MSELWVQRWTNGKWDTRWSAEWQTATDQKEAQRTMEEGWHQEGGCWRLVSVDLKVQEQAHSCCE